MGRMVSNQRITKKTNEVTLDMWLEIYNAPSVDLSDAEALDARLKSFIDMCRRYNVKPGVSAWCQYINCTRDEIINWSKGKRTRLDSILTSRSAQVLQKSFGLFEMSWETAFLNNEFYAPATGIFYAKNNFGYRDESSTIVKHAESEKGPDVKELQAKYAAAIPEPIEVEATVEKVEQKRLE